MSEGPDPGREPALLAVRDLAVRLPAGADRPFAIAGIGFEVARRETLCIVGETGSGKSVTAHAVMGLLPPTLAVTAGSIRFEGEEIRGAPAAAMRRLRGRRIGMIFQEASAALNPVRTIGDQVAEIIRAHERLPAEEVERRVLAGLAEVNLPDPRALAGSFPFRLSGGQQQRVMIAIALALAPALLIADEPTTALDVTTQAQILRLIGELQARRAMAVLFVTHDLGVVAEIADRIVVMRHGRIVEAGTADRILNAPAEDYTRRLIAAVPRFGGARPAPPARPPALAAAGLTKTFAGHAAGLFRRRPPVAALAGVSLAVAEGETLGIVGESGSGKSTLARCLMRLTPLDGGRFTIHGVPFSDLAAPALRHERHRIQMVFQDPYASLNPRQRVATIVTTGLAVQGVPAAEARRRAAEMLALVGLDPSAMERFPHEFSGGQRQRIAIARALVLEPQVLIADEAVSSLDVSVQAQVLALFAAIRDRLRLALIFITHDLLVAAQICDRVLVMRAGRVVEEGPAGEVFAAPRHPYTQALVAAIPGRDWLARDPTHSPARPRPE
ncbi:MAG: ABC transporter ATP-binding protein [Rhodobacteraceae bacterium]|nr:ABC transporter ATP-binding protein [Paracoccaceae bacterium]